MGSCFLRVHSGPRLDRLHAAKGPRRWGPRGSLGPAGWTMRDRERGTGVHASSELAGNRLLVAAHRPYVQSFVYCKKILEHGLSWEHGLVGQADGPERPFVSLTLASAS